MQKCRTATQISQDKKGLFNRLCFVSGEENIVQKETHPMGERSDRPDQIEKQKEGNSFAAQVSGSILGGKKRTIGGTPEESKVIVHSVEYPSLPCTSAVHEKSP